MIYVHLAGADVDADHRLHSPIHRLELNEIIKPVHKPTLGEIVRQLIIRFGPDSPAAQVLASNAHSTPGAVTSLRQFNDSQLANAIRWSDDEDPLVSRWGQERVREFKSEVEAWAAREEYEDRTRR